MDDAKKIVPADVLAMQPTDAAALTLSLDEVNRFVLVRSLVHLALQAPLPSDRACTLGAVFAALGRARLKLHAWNLLIESGLPTTHTLECIKAVNTHVGPVITAIFGVPFGMPGIGVKPQMGLTDEDREDLAMVETMTLSGFGPMFDAMVASARLAGALVVEESV